MKLNKTNLKNLIGKNMTSIISDNDTKYLVSINFILRITNPDALKLLNEIPRHEGGRTYGAIKNFIKASPVYSQMKLKYAGEYNTFDSIKVNFSDYKSDIEVRLDYVQLFELLNNVPITTLKNSIKDNLLYIEGHGVIGGMEINNNNRGCI